MAARLPIVMIQSSPPSSRGMDLRDQMIGELIGAPGMDLVLVGDPSSWSPTSSDRLSIESLAGDVVVLDWSPVQQIESSMRSVSSAWTRARHANDQEASLGAGGAHRLFAFDLRDIDHVDDLIIALKQLLRSRQVSTISLGGTAGSLGGTTDATATNVPSSGSRSVSADSLMASESKAPPPDDLDALIDQLDESDT